MVWLAPSISLQKTKMFPSVIFSSAEPTPPSLAAPQPTPPSLAAAQPTTPSLAAAQPIPPSLELSFSSAKVTDMLPPLQRSTAGDNYKPSPVPETFVAKWVSSKWHPEVPRYYHNHIKPYLGNTHTGQRARAFQVSATTYACERTAEPV